MSQPHPKLTHLVLGEDISAQVNELRSGVYAVVFDRGHEIGVTRLRQRTNCAISSRIEPGAAATGEFFVNRLPSANSLPLLFWHSWPRGGGGAVMNSPVWASTVAWNFEVA